MKIIKIEDKKKESLEDLRSTLEHALYHIEQYSEIMVIGKYKDRDKYDMFPSDIKSAFWWVGALEAINRHLMEEYLSDVSEEGE